MTGHTLSHYRIDAELGRGGMGIVYRATDTKLNRTVALKVLPAAALASPDDRARFVREAQSAAQLHHPNIATVFGIDEAVPEGEGAGGESRLFIAMEYIEGETLREHAQKGPMKLQQAVSIAGQIAEALKVAHAKDIVHRDIKSANIMLTADGVAKVLDFGLAKTNASTMLTRMGSTLGTVAYMSPEQARGQEVDGRSDLYSLGTVLYEMVAGVLPFAGDYEQAVLYSILNETPEPLTAVRTGVPMQLEWIVNKLLAKEAEYRYQTAADLLADLKSLDLSGSGRTQRSMPAVSAASMPAVATSGLPAWIWAVVAGIALVALAAGWLLKPIPPAAERPVVRFSLPLEGEQLNRAGRRAIALSPDGTMLAYVSRDGIVLRPMGNLNSARLALSGTNGRGLFFSPDGRWLAYEDTENAWLMRIDLFGGSPVRIADLPTGTYGASWAETGDIYLAFGAGGLGRVAASGGVVEILVGPDSSGARYSSPFLLPDQHTLVFTASTGPWSEAHLRLLNLDSRTQRQLHPTGRDARYMATGHLVYLWDNSLYALPFDPVGNERTGAEAPVAQDVWPASASGTGHFDISSAGSLVSVRGTGDATIGARLGWATAGAIDPLSNNERVYEHVSIGPDDTRAVVAVSGEDGSDVWIVDTVSGNATRMTSSGSAYSPVWHPGGALIAYAQQNAGILARDPENPESIDTLYAGRGLPSSWSPDGRFLLFEAGPAANEDLLYLDLDSGEIHPFQQTDADTQSGAFSPDGRWVAYTSDESGEDQVYVRLFPSGGERIRLSDEFGIQPTWSRDGSTVYFASEGGIWASRFNLQTGVAQPAQRVDLPAAVFPWDGFDVDSDGRILVPHNPGNSLQGTPVIDIVINFAAELRERVPRGR